MGIDINKIITESIQDIREGDSDEVTEIENQNQDVVTETTDVQEPQNQDDDTNKESNIMETAVQSAISAGLGAMTFRRHFKNIQEGKIGNAAKKIGKYGSLAAGAGGLGYAIGNPDGASDAWDSVKKAVSSKTAEASEAGEKAGEKAGEAGEKAGEEAGKLTGSETDVRGGAEDLQNQTGTSKMTDSEESARGGAKDLQNAEQAKEASKMTDSEKSARASSKWANKQPFKNAMSRKSPFGR